MENSRFKFRAWYDHRATQEMLFVGDDMGTSHPLDCCKYFMEGQPVTLMQFTGLTDKDGVDIYEGDIVEDQFLSGQLHIIEYNIDAATFTKRYTTENFLLNRPSPISVCPATITKGKVIGNIHENPELLS